MTKQLAIKIVLFGIALGFAFAGIRLSKDHITIGLYKGDEFIFSSTQRIRESTGTDVEIVYYQDLNEIQEDILSGRLDIYVCSPFEYIAQEYPGIAVAAIESDYILAGTIKKTPVQVGICEQAISTLLLANSPKLHSTKLQLTKFNSEDIPGGMKEGALDFAVFRNRIPKGLQIPIDIRLSELGISHDYLVVSNDFIKVHPQAVRAIFASLLPKYHLLPPEHEFDKIINHLFKYRFIPKRRPYTDFVHIE